MPRTQSRRKAKKYRKNRKSKRRSTQRGGSIKVGECGLNKTIWILWLQGWDKAPWLAHMIKESWIHNNPGWSVVLLSESNLSEYTTDIPYIQKPGVTLQAKSDIIRLSILNKHGGVWADATLLCTQTLDTWVCKATEPSGFWMYHGSDWGTDINHGPASWFIVSKAQSYIISKWKAACDQYWAHHNEPSKYLWMDDLFKEQYDQDEQFKKSWDSIENIDCEADIQAHMFSNGIWKENTPALKAKLKSSPPRVIKLWTKVWEAEFPDISADKCILSNGYYAIQYSRGKQVI